MILLMIVGDLIETLWNVKPVLPVIHFLHSQRFNRDIVECKEMAVLN